MPYRRRALVSTSTVLAEHIDLLETNDTWSDEYASSAFNLVVPLRGHFYARTDEGDALVDGTSVMMSTRDGVYRMRKPVRQSSVVVTVRDEALCDAWKCGRATTTSAMFDTPEIPIDSTCVRIGSMRSHSPSLTFKLRKNVPLADFEDMIKNDNPWVKYVPNERVATETQLTAKEVAGTMTIPVGRVRKLAMGPEYLGAFTIGDQLLWGAAEPLRRMLRIIQGDIA